MECETLTDRTPPDLQEQVTRALSRNISSVELIECGFMVRRAHRTFVFRHLEVLKEIIHTPRDS
jgi:hypothetical protein